MNNLKKYYRACEKLKDDFVFTYFLTLEDTYWIGDEIGDEIGGVLSVGDFFIDMQTISQVMKFEMNNDEFHDWYWWRLDFKNPPLNIMHYLFAYRKDKKILNSKSAKKIQKDFEKLVRDKIF